MSYKKYEDMTDHQLRSEIGNLEQRQRELSERVRNMRVALLVKKSTHKPGSTVVDSKGRRGVVEVDECDANFLRVALFKKDGTPGLARATLYSHKEWTAEEAQHGREDA